MYARIGTFEVDSTQLDAAIEHFRISAVKAFSVHEGFLGYQAYVDRERGHIVGISRWTSREALEASNESAHVILSRANELGAVIVGEPQILEEAFDAKPVHIQA